MYLILYIYNKWVYKKEIKYLEIIFSFRPQNDLFKKIRKTFLYKWLKI